MIAYEEATKNAYVLYSINRDSRTYVSLLLEPKMQKEICTRLDSKSHLNIGKRVIEEPSTTAVAKGPR